MIILYILHNFYAKFSTHVHYAQFFVLDGNSCDIFDILTHMKKS